VSKSKTEYQLGDLVSCYYRKISDQTAVAGRVTTNLGSRTTALEFGGEHRPYDGVTLKGKIDSAGKLGVSYSSQINAGLKLTVASLFDTLKITRSSIADYSLGFRLEFSG
jgi:hypothetical protein